MVPETRPLLEPSLTPVPDPWWSFSLTANFDGRAVRMPQTIAHRGYKASCPENTIAAFQAATAVGAHALETDLHLTKDGVVVLSHDGTLKRCFGIDKKINECDWSYVQTLRTLREPHLPMPRLVDLLELLVEPGYEHLWILLDIKTDDDAEALLRCVAETIDLAPCRAGRDWRQRIMLGCWNMAYIEKTRKLLPNYPLAYIGFSLSHARQIFSIPNVAFNILQKVLVGPSGTKFLRECAEAQRPVFVWTVDEEEWMQWSIAKGVDGVITDDPKLFRDVCRRWGADAARRAESGVVDVVGSKSLARRASMMLECLWLQALALMFTGLFMVTGRLSRVTTRQQQRMLIWRENIEQPL